MKQFKKVWRYIRRYKKLLTISIISMLIVQMLGLLAPLIVRSILDDQLVGITKQWYETTDSSKVAYQGNYYTQDANEGAPLTIVIVNGKYLAIFDEIVSGNQQFVATTETEGQLTITTFEGDKVVYTAQILTGGEVSSFYAPFLQPIFILLGLLILRYVFHILFLFIQRITTAFITTNVVRDARKDAVKALQNMPMSYFEYEPAGKIANRIITDVNGMINLFSTLMNLVFNSFLSVIFAYIGMFYLDSTLALFTFILFPLIYIWLKVFIRNLNEIAQKVSESASMITAQLNEIINGINVLQIFNYQEQTEKEFEVTSNIFRSEQLKEQRLHLSIGWNMIRLLGFLVTAFIVAYFGFQSLTVGTYVMTAGTIYAYNDFLSRLMEPVGVLFREFGNLQLALVRTDRIFTIIDAEQEDDSFEEIERFKGKIEFEDITFAYSKDAPVLKNVSLNIEEGSMVGIVGHTGSGKSTMMNLLLRFYDFKDGDSGKIYIDGVDIQSYSKRTYRNHIGMILQDPMIYKGTIASNVKFGQDVTDEEVESVLREIGGGPMIDKLPEGIHQPLYRGGSNLSVGEKQLISFARAVIHNPAILIMDEATANIDTETESLIQTALNKVKEGRTTIVIAHRLSTIKHANKIVVLDNGFKVEEGTHDQLLELDKQYAHIYKSQMNVKIENV
ncbi:ABC transporter ATP-binding protein [Acholeplasma laidlawii]|uniref:ABC-type transport system, permease and ATPase components n=2 Tax=Acholeplasma laidlawii TaxID=2148 RepID=A9NGM1_ACHLI|nr:ABC transporter ATP-binding protein [Acholeplasma laidlawii]ABX81501.1 ABC-type transport system, permease and ATPase components [Acholeplasma laidlawii PG-8A]NWH11315.1 ABC transporter ATP-binding protein [Acholeplasma laidlawii]NWH13275.1 ABC transporter ATP-binding protein [Acholeplasma laidlawii]OAN20290.1 ABC transporter permease [Acholeplasma laidlawii]OED27864.1 ABC transporter permease [Acholeplasma laidlawii]